ncbi:energy transducer TonB [Sphingomonas lutea]|uniref:Energy transducer TonB n=1 Tax=Sphingomonas lutea TaxID=1045317 RepID=A0A7G9SFD0_9SPHN|nr:energy transducer TonB [Sphingomonas lutea]QNN66555.1 energy transducer TonB [Sphingomonas lutea]
MRIVVLLLSATFAGLSVPAAAETSTAAQNARDMANLSVLQSYYPARALAAREQGPVGFRVKIDASGQPTECQVTQSSGYPLLDKETCDLITLRAVFKRAEGVSGSQVSTHDGVVNWKLPDSMSIKTLTSPQRVATAVAPEKKICKKSVKTGSLVATERVCMTSSQWKRQSDESKQFWEENSRKGSTSGN